MRWGAKDQWLLSKTLNAFLEHLSADEKEAGRIEVIKSIFKDEIKIFVLRTDEVLDAIVVQSEVVYPIAKFYSQVSTLSSRR